MLEKQGCEKRGKKETRKMRWGVEDSAVSLAVLWGDK